MEIRVLRYFLMVAREENITKAAELLHITQPTLSRQLIQLEKELETKLFERTRHNIHLTEDGMLLKRRAQELVQLADKTEREFRRREEQLSGSIAIGSGETNNVQVLADIIRKFQAEHPMVQYDLYTANADEIKERIDKGLLDIGLLMEPVDITKYSFIRLKRKEKWGILVSKDSELSEKSSVTPQDLINVPVFLAQRPILRNEIEGWLGEYYDQVRVMGTYNLINNAAVMVEKNVGAAFCFRLENRYDNLRFIPLSPPLETGAVIVWKKAQAVSRTMQQFIAHIRQHKDI